MSSLETHPRYQTWQEPFRAQMADVLRPGVTILDVGGGRHPAIRREDLPSRARYIGLDLSLREMQAAPTGSYDEMIEADIAEPVPELVGAIDLAVSWQVLEHVVSMQSAIANLHAYLRPGGRLVAHLSGGRAVFALINRAIPHALAAAALRQLLDRDPETIFPARYDACTYTGLTRVLKDWSRVRIEPRFAGAGYLGFSRPLQRLYLLAEDRLARGNHPDLATHYLVVADR